MIGRILCRLGWHRWFTLIQEVEYVTQRSLSWQRCVRIGCPCNRVVGVPFPEL